MEKARVSIIGPGDIGTDLMYKVMKSNSLETKLMTGIVESEGIGRAAGLGFGTSVGGVDAIAVDTEICIVFDATSVRAHLHNTLVLKKAGKTVMDVTPATVGPYVVPRTNMDSLLFDMDDFDMVTYGGQATVPIAYVTNRVADSEYTEIAPVISSKGIGPGTKANIDEFTETTSKTLEIVAGSDKGEATIVLNPANPPLMMANAAYTLAKNSGEARIKNSVGAIVKKVKSYVLGCRLRKPSVLDGNRATVTVEMEGAGDSLLAYFGNLDTINQAAVITAEKVAGRPLGGKRQNGMTRRKVRLIDTTLRDGSHATNHNFTADQIKAVAEGLDRAGVDLVELNHGDGIGGPFIDYGLSAADELTLLRVAGEVIKNTKLAVPLLPEVDTIENLKRMKETGIGAVRVATYVTEVDVSAQHIRCAKSKGLFVVRFLMMSHMAEPEKIVGQARIFEAEGADYINLADSAGYMLLNDVHRRIAALKGSVSVSIRFHAHNNMGLTMGNSLAALEIGAKYLDRICRGLGTGAGNTQMEVLYVVPNRMGYDIHADIRQTMNTTQTIVEPLMHRPQIIRTDSLMLGYAGVYSSFLLHMRRAVKQFGIDVRDILIELRRRDMVGGQEDMTVDVAYELPKNKF